MTDDEKALELLKAVRELEAWRLENAPFRSFYISRSVSVGKCEADTHAEMSQMEVSVRAEKVEDAIIALAARLREGREEGE